jgi:hypothetical protein
MKALWRWCWRWLKRGLVALAVVVLSLLVPVGWTELQCQGTSVEEGYVSLLPPDQRRPESRTLMTYPEWGIVHAYEDYAAVIATGAPHDYDFLPAIAEYWSSLCTLTTASAAHGGADWPTRQMVYTIGVSFTAELLAKGAYEETLGRLAVWMRGPKRAQLDDLSARQAESYAAFLSQVPWYQWNFTADRDALLAANTGSLRDWERAGALGVEFSVKAQYAKLIAAAVAATGKDALRMRVIVAGLSPEALAAAPEVRVIGARPEGIEVETPRYAAFTTIARDWAKQGGKFVEIAGNDDILFTALSENPEMPGAMASYPRQGHGDTRHLMLVKVSDLAAALISPVLVIEHIHDY